MKRIKLHTINSTNSFLKDLIKNIPQENFTVVVADIQTFGRGQVKNKWVSEPYKNLTFSVFMSFDNLCIAHQKYLNYTVSLAIFKVLGALGIPNLKIKWPNDILSEKKKLCGILIENQLQGSKIVSSVIGIGLNVNQLFFDGLPNATSLQKLTEQEFSLEDVLNKIMLQLQQETELLRTKKFKELETQYLQNLYNYQIWSTFKAVATGTSFRGKIVGVTEMGRLQIELENQKMQTFGIKEVRFI